MLEFLRRYFKRHSHKNKQDVFNAFDHIKMYDESYLASWDEKDGEKIKNILSNCRNGDLTEREADVYLSVITHQIERKWNDHKSSGGFLYPLDVSYKFDKITDFGLSLICGLACGKVLPPVSHMALGDGLGPTTDYQDVLYSEKIRYALGDNGFTSSLGKTMRYYMEFDIMEPSYNFTEIGLYNNPNFGVGPLCARAVFPETVEHVSGYNYITGFYLINTLSG